MSTLPALRRNERLTGSARRQLAEQLAARYNRGQSIREICSDTGYSISRVRGLLIGAGVTFRRRGGSRHRSKGT